MVTVLLPVYNAVDTIKETVESVLCQTFEDYEFIIINDGSNDGTADLLNEFNDRRITIINKGNEGLVKTLNLGISAAKGKYIARVDADDICLPERLQEQVEFLERNPDVSVLGTVVKVLYPDGKTQIRKRPLSPEQVRKNILKICPVAHPTVMMRTETVKGVGCYDIKFDASLGFSVGEDYHLWVKILRTGAKIANLDKPLLILRKTHGSVSGGKSLKFKLIERIKMRLWIKNYLNIGCWGYFPILLVGLATIFHESGFNIDGLFNFISKNNDT
ncbi:MAG: glycosyltransferase [Deltaproteobacteria bacterium]|nr:glycosyltransferase [Deltaproteobacteria bacterium]